LVWPSSIASGLCYVWVTLHGELRNPEFLRVLERIAAFIPPLVEEGFLEPTNRAKPAYVLARRLHAALRQSGVYTRRKGLDRETNKELLLKHITESQGARMEEFRQILPFLERSQIQVLLRELSEAGRVHHHGTTKAARWFPGLILRDCNHE